MSSGMHFIAASGLSCLEGKSKFRVFLQVVVVLDPDIHKDYLDRVQNRSKEKKYVFDIAFGPDATNQVNTISSVCL